MKKKKNICSKAETGWATAHLSHDTRNCFVTQQSWVQQQGRRHGQPHPRYGHGNGWLRARACGSACAHDLASKVCRDTIRCIVTGGAARLRYGRGHGLATRPRCATIRRWGLQHTRQHATRHACMTLVLGVSRYRLRHGQPGLRHHRPQSLCARPGRCARAVCEQPGSVGCAPCAPNPVLT